MVVLDSAPQDAGSRAGVVASWPKRVDEVGAVEVTALQGEGYGRARMLPVVMMICT
jgi:hypothetical protein